MFFDNYGNKFKNEEEYLKSLKKEDYYHFIIPFEYIKKHYDNGECDFGIANMDIDVRWDDSCCGYIINHRCPDMYKIDPNEGNGDEEEFYNEVVYYKVLEELETIGIGITLIV